MGELLNQEKIQKQENIYIFIGIIKLKINKLWYSLLDINSEHYDLEKDFIFNQNRSNILKFLLTILTSYQLYQSNKIRQNPWLLLLISPKSLYVYEFIYNLLFILAFGYEARRVKEVAELQICSIQLLNIFINNQIDQNELKNSIIELMPSQLNDDNISYYQIWLHYLQQCDICKIFQESKNLYQHDNIKEIITLSVKEIFQNAACIFISNFNRNKISDNEIFHRLIQFIYKAIQNPLLERKKFILIGKIFQKQSLIKKTSLVGESFYLMWKLIENNEYFLELIVEYSKEQDIYYYLLEYLMKGSEIGHYVFILMVNIISKLSLIKEFHNVINKPLETNLRISNLPILQSSIADILSLAIIKLSIKAITRNNSLSPFLPTLLSTLHNISLYIQNLSKLTSYCFGDLISLLSQYEILLHNFVINFQCVYQILNIINNIITLQCNNNKNFIIQLWERQEELENILKIKFTPKILDFFYQSQLNQQKAIEFNKENDEKHQNPNFLQNIEQNINQFKTINIAKQFSQQLNLIELEQNQLYFQQLQFNKNLFFTENYQKQIIDLWNNYKKQFPEQNLKKLFTFLNQSLMKNQIFREIRIQKQVQMPLIRKEILEIIVNDQNFINIFHQNSQINVEVIQDLHSIEQIMQQYVYQCFIEANSQFIEWKLSDQKFITFKFNLELLD